MATWALTHSKTNRLYFFTRLSSTSLHSKFAWHSAMSGAPLIFAFSGVRSNVSNLSIPGPWLLPIPITAPIGSRVGTLKTHSLLLRISSRLWFRSQMEHSTWSHTGIMCRPIVMTFRSPAWAEPTRTTGPGSRNRRI